MSLSAWLIRAFQESPMPTIIPQILNMGPEFVHLCSLMVKAKQAKGPGGKKITPEEKAEILVAVHDLLVDAVDRE